MNQEQLIESAKRVRKNAHAPYSGFFVGSAVLDELGRVHVGCNIENSAFPSGACAETSAIGAMVAAGGRKIVAIVALGGKDGLVHCAPCGGCRQQILEFADAETKIIYLHESGEFTIVGIADLLPASFSLDT